MGILTAKNVCWFAGYVLVVFFVIFLLNEYRARAISNYSTPEARQNWQKWRDAAEASGRHGGVERSQPKSSEPPSLVLMRDHFAACVGISTLLTSCLYIWFMVCVRGVMKPHHLPADTTTNVSKSAP